MMADERQSAAREAFGYSRGSKQPSIDDENAYMVAYQLRGSEPPSRRNSKETKSQRAAK